MRYAVERDLSASQIIRQMIRKYIQHALRAVLALDGEDYQKHSAVIARFSLNYLKTDILPREYGKLISNASLIRNRSDYEDFYICSVEDTQRLVEGAELSWECVNGYLHNRWKKE